VVGGRWVGSHGPTGGGLLLKGTREHLEHGPGMPEGCRPAEWRSCVSVDRWLGRPEGLGLAELLRVCGVEAQPWHG
jgi:hypothetical protein